MISLRFSLILIKIVVILVTYVDSIDFSCYKELQLFISEFIFPFIVIGNCLPAFMMANPSITC